MWQPVRGEAIKRTITVLLHLDESLLTNHNKKHTYISIIQCYLLEIIIHRFKFFFNVKYSLCYCKKIITASIMLLKSDLVLIK